ncbi:MAG TPA: hypothetical protein VM791_05100 [Vicinamibacterales bacterium]|nr:hypothetical protein [Vicinamibacterales bacterium]
MNPQIYLFSKLTRIVATAGLVVATSAGTGCERPSSAAGQGRVEPSYDQSTGKLTRLAYDANNDGKHDTWAFMDGAKLTRLEADENQDGRIDRWEFYPDNATKGAKQTPERIERSTRFDGQVSRREFFENGVMARVEEDTDGNGTIDKWETYSGGALVVLALDTQGHGKPDRRLVYNAEGGLEKIESDPSGSGHFEVVK